METGKTGKYFKYAIGEIILVVIGILIALSINNWNENRKLQNEELKLLSDLKTNLETAYKTLQTKGLDIIKNQTLKKDIVNTYDVHFIVLTQDYDKAEWNLNTTVLTPFFAKHIRRYDDASLSVAKPNNFENLKQNDEFLNILSMIIRQRKRGLEFYREVMIGTNKLIQDIEAEINLRTI
jgi:hypothetical protein